MRAYQKTSAALVLPKWLINYLLGQPCVVILYPLLKEAAQTEDVSWPTYFFFSPEAFSAPIFVTGPDRNGFNVGIRKNLQQVFGEDRRMWFIPVFTRWVRCIFSLFSTFWSWLFHYFIPYSALMHKVIATKENLFWKYHITSTALLIKLITYRIY